MSKPCIKFSYDGDDYRVDAEGDDFKQVMDLLISGNKLLLQQLFPDNYDEAKTILAELFSNAILSEE